LTEEPGRVVGIISGEMEIELPDAWRIRMELTAIQNRMKPTTYVMSDLATGSEWWHNKPQR
jgi:hypothetical protein